MVNVKINLSADLKGWAEQMLGNLGVRSNSPLNRAMQAAISRTLTTARVRVSQAIRQTLALPARTVKNQMMTIKRPSYTRLAGYLSLLRKPVPMVDFAGATFVLGSGKVVQVRGNKVVRVRGNRTRPKAVKVKVRKRASGKWPGGTETLPHAFLARMLETKAGKRHLGVYERTGEFAVAVKGRYKGQRRERIAERYGLTAAAALAFSAAETPGSGEQRLLDEVASEMGDVLAKNMASQIDRFLRPRRS